MSPIGVGKPPARVVPERRVEERIEQRVEKEKLGNLAGGAPVVPAAPLWNANAVRPAGTRVDGKITHLGKPVEWGGEKEFGPDSFSSAGTRLQATQPAMWNPSLTAAFDAGKFIGGGHQKAAAARSWDDLNDAGKAAWVAAYRKLTGHPPVLRVRENPTVRKIDHEPDGSIEFVSKKMPDTRKLKAWLTEYGWGHIHTSFVRSGSPVQVKQQVSWNVNANLFMFLSALERRNAGAPTNPADAGKVGGTNWPFTIKTLSVPTQEHTQIWGQFLTDLTKPATSFTKHLMINIRTGIYEDDGGVRERNRVGNEIRGGIQVEKERVLDSLGNALVDGQWGREPTGYGQDGFRLMNVGTTNQPKSLPRDYETLLAQSGVPAAEASKLFNFVAGARFFDVAPASRLNEFDQRAGMPLLPYEKIGWLSAPDKARAVSARNHFIEQLSALQGEAVKNHMPATEVAQRYSALVIGWAKEARLAEPVGQWLDGQQRRSIFRTDDAAPGAAPG
jgi:hypothetical protein